MLAALAALVVLPSCQPQPVIAYPNLRVLVPTNAISISTPSASQRTLDFAHITWNAGDGPLEIHPQFDPATGQATATQALYTLTGPTAWTLVKSIPIVKPMTWDPPSDYRFPLSTFGLYTNTSTGSVGTLVATSPKVDFCMTPDTFVGGVPNTTATGVPSPGDCDDPNGVLGLSVGWGDLYDHEDAGNNIDISNLADGTYWLRAQADPGNYFAQSGPNQSVTDTELQIRGTTVTVLQQVTPTPTRPVVVITSPKDGSSINGPTTVQAVAAGGAAITSVQFSVDGTPAGARVTSTPYQTTLNGLSPGTHVLSAQATDANGFLGTSAGVTVNVPIEVGSIVIDHNVNATGAGHVSAPPVATTMPGETLVALVGSDDAGPGETTTVSGGGLSWALIRRVNAQRGDSEIWSASVPSATAGVGVGVDSTQPGMNLSLTVLAVQNAVPGASASASGASGAPAVSYAASAPGSVAVGVGNDFDRAVDRTLGAGQSLASQWLDSGTGDTYWSQYSTVPSTAAGQRVTLNDTAPTNDRWNFAAVELRPTGSAAAAATAAPARTDASTPSASEPVAGADPPLAISVSSPSPGQPVSGTIDVSATVADDVPITSVQFTLDGRPLGSARTAPPYTTSWNTVTALPGAHTLAATATDESGRSAVAASVPVTVATQSVCFVKDATTTARGSGAITTPAFHTAIPDELLLAFVTYDGPPAGGQQTTVSGAGLTWRLVRRATGGRGVAEIWSATTMSVQTGAQVTATPDAAGFDGYLQVVALQGTGGLGATAVASGTTGSPTVAVTATKPQSLVFAVGSVDAETPVSPGTNQVVDGQSSDTTDQSTSWVQNSSLQTGAAGTPVTIDDTSPTAGSWNLVAVEIVAADTVAYTS